MLEFAQVVMFCVFSFSSTPYKRTKFKMPLFRISCISLFCTSLTYTFPRRFRPLHLPFSYYYFLLLKGIIRMLEELIFLSQSGCNHRIFCFNGLSLSLFLSLRISFLLLPLSHYPFIFLHSTLKTTAQLIVAIKLSSPFSLGGWATGRSQS